MATWSYVRNGGARTTFADAGLGKLSRTLESQSKDICTFEAPGLAIDGTSPFTDGDSVTLYKGNDPWFAGIIVDQDTVGADIVESKSWSLWSPWYYIVNTIYQQKWYYWDLNIGSFVFNWRSRVIIGQDITGYGIQVSLNSGEVITQVLQYILDQHDSAPFRIGTIDVDAVVPWDEITDIFCSEVIIKVLRWTPDAVIHWDYSSDTLPPRISVSRRGTMAAVELNANGSTNLAAARLRPRTDLVASAVVINYEQTAIVEREERLTIARDAVPSGSLGTEMRALVLTVELAGIRSTLARQELGTQVIDTTDVAWWAERIPWLGDATIGTVVLHDQTRSLPALALPNEIIIGGVTEWMDGQTREETFTALVDYIISDENGDLVKVMHNQLISAVATTTDLTGTITSAGDPTYPGDDAAGRDMGQIYTTTLIDADDAESVPTGVAQQLYDALSVVHYEGIITLLETEVTSSVVPGNVVNIINGQSTWSTMRALVQRISENVDQGITSISVGPPTQVGPQDLIEMARANRRRIARVVTSAERTDGISRGTGRQDTIQLDRETATASGAGKASRVVVAEDAAIVTKKIDIDPAQLTQDGYVMVAKTTDGVTEMAPGWPTLQDVT